MKFDFQGIDEYDQMIVKLGDSYGPTCEKMLNAAIKVVAAKLKAANSIFARHVKPQKAKHNTYGWFAQVHFGGKVKNRSETNSGTSAARAAVIYEYGREAGTYVENGKTVRYPDQPARPFIRSTAAASEDEVAAEMEKIYDEEVGKLVGGN